MISDRRVIDGGNQTRETAEANLSQLLNENALVINDNSVANSQWKPLIDTIGYREGFNKPDLSF